MSEENKKFYQSNLDAFRGLAFLLIFLYHTISEFKGGYIGVQAFLVLSGYLITPILINIKSEKANFLAYYKVFILKRILRIFPIYFLYLVVLFLFIFLFNLDKINYFIDIDIQLKYAFLFFYNYYHSLNVYVHNMYVSHFWSLSVEEQFYLIWPFIIFFSNKKHLKKTLIVILIASLFFRFFYFLLIQNGNYSMFTSDYSLLIYVNTFTYFDAFSIGALISLYNFRNIKPKIIFIVLFFIFFIGIISEYNVNGKLNLMNLGYAPYMKDSFKFIWGYTALNIGFAFVLIGLKNKTLLNSFFENNFLKKLGKISYGMYIYHYGIYGSFTLLNDKFQFLNDDLLFNRLFIAFITFLVTYMISYLSFQYFEMKFLNLKKHIK